VPPEPIQEQKPPGVPAPDKPAQSAEAIVSVAPPKGLGASNIIGKYIFGPDDKSIGWVEDITISDKGEVSGIVVTVSGSTNKLFFWKPQHVVTVPYGSVKWVVERPAANSLETVVDRGLVSSDLYDKIKLFNGQSSK
jgi:sporulation protein YlmC with PRC-barrel domain